MLSKLITAFLPRNKHLWISWLQSPSTVILEPPKIKVSHCFHCFPIYFPKSDGNKCHIFVFWMLSFKPTFSLSTFTFIKRLFGSSSLSAIRMCCLRIWCCGYFSQQYGFQFELHPAQHFAPCTLHRIKISMVTIYSLDILLSQFWISPWITSQNQDAWGSINNLRYADDTTLTAESEELKSLLMKVKEESEKAGLKLSVKKTKIMASGPITSWQIDGETLETVIDFILGGLQNYCRWWLQPWTKRCLLLGRKAMTNLVY